MSDTFVGPKIEQEPGGDTTTVKSGGTINFDSGSTLSLDDGATFTGTKIQRKMVAVVLPSATALSTVVPGTPAVNTDLACTVKSVKLLLEGALAGHATSNSILTVKLISALATATTTVASKTFTTGNAVTAYVPATITLTTSLAVATGESLVAAYTFASSGQDVPKGTLTIEYVVDA